MEKIALKNRLYISEVTTKPWALEKDVACYQHNNLGLVFRCKEGVLQTAIGVF